jgi:nucleoside-diphosphate-sugar epimerase
VLDLVNAYALLGEKILKGQGWEVDSEFNVGPRSGQEYSVLDLVNEFQASGMPVEISIQSSKFHEADKLQISSLKSETTLNWSPKLDFSSAVHLTSEWYEVVSQRGVDAFEVTKSQVKDFLSMENCK